MREPSAIVMTLLAVCVRARVSASDGTLLLSDANGFQDAFAFRLR